MPFTLNTSASFAISSSTSSGNPDSTFGRAYQVQTTYNKDGTTYTRRTQRHGEPIIEETRRWDGKGRRVLEDGSVYEKNGKGKGWKQVQGPTMKPVESGSGSGKSRKRGTILGMTTDPSPNILEGSKGPGNGWGKNGIAQSAGSSPMIGGTSLNGLMGKIANDALESRGKGRILKEVDSVTDSEDYTSSEDYTDSDDYTSEDYTDEEEAEVEAKPKTNTKKNTTRDEKTRPKKTSTHQKTNESGKGKAQKQKQKEKPAASRFEEISTEDEDHGFEVEEVFSSEEDEGDEVEEQSEEEESEEEKPRPKRPAKKGKSNVPKGKNSKKSVAVP